MGKGYRQLRYLTPDLNHIGITIKFNTVNYLTYLTAAFLQMQLVKYISTRHSIPYIGLYGMAHLQIIQSTTPIYRQNVNRCNQTENAIPM
jgi:hypothetical protein